MKTKAWITLGLLLFLALCLLYLVAGKALRSSPTRQEMASSSDTVHVAGRKAATPRTGKGVSVVAYYFHGNIRCVTCRRIEAFTREAMKKYFSEALADGRLKLKVINVDNDENNHFVRDYALTFQTVILSRRVNGKEVAWKNLKDVWKYSGNRDKFFRYIKQETAVMLQKNGP